MIVTAQELNKAFRRAQLKQADWDNLSPRVKKGYDMVIEEFNYIVKLKLFKEGFTAEDFEDCWVSSLTVKLNHVKREEVTFTFDVYVPRATKTLIVECTAIRELIDDYTPGNSEDKKDADTSPGNP